MKSLINFKVESEIKNQLEKQAHLKKITLSEYLRQIVTEKISPYKSKLNPFSRLTNIISKNEVDN
ncbi:MAG: hypothetical protein AAGF07_01410 [Patescibacteria group bacterium]